MIIALFIRFLYVIDFFVPLAYRRFKGFVITLIALEHQQKKQLRGLLLASSHICYQCFTMGRYSLTDSRYHLRKKVRLRVAPVASGEMSVWAPDLIGV
jgi:hypothetical protein